LTMSNFPTSQAQVSKGKVFVMYAASLRVPDSLLCHPNNSIIVI
jgi:hypothetical protein